MIPDGMGQREYEWWVEREASRLADKFRAGWDVLDRPERRALKQWVKRQPVFVDWIGRVAAAENDLCGRSA